MTQGTGLPFIRLQLPWPLVRGEKPSTRGGEKRSSSDAHEASGESFQGSDFLRSLTRRGEKRARWGGKGESLHRPFSLLNYNQIQKSSPLSSPAASGSSWPALTCRSSPQPLLSARMGPGVWAAGGEEARALACAGLLQISAACLSTEGRHGPLGVPWLIAGGKGIIRLRTTPDLRLFTCRRGTNSEQRHSLPALVWLSCSCPRSPGRTPLPRVPSVTS